MAEIEIRSTSRRTAECTAVVLRSTDRVRLVFVPTLVDNDQNPQACVRGHFVYQRKAKHGEWEPINTLPLSSLKSGEEYRLELHSDELLTLLKTLGPLYRLYRQQGITKGQTTFVRLEASLARFLTLGQAELTAFLDANREAAATTLLKLIRWMAESAQSTEAAARLAEMAPEALPSFNALLGLAAMKDALAYWHRNHSNASEEFWQRALADRAYVLSQAFAYPIVVIQAKAYVGGKRITNRGGNIVDFLASVESTEGVILIEIKTPQTKLLGLEYRQGTFPLSSELSGAVAQVLRYRQSLMQEFRTISASVGEKQLVLGEPRCLVIAGSASVELKTEPMKESFELLRERFQGVTVITYDELFSRLEQLTAFLEK